MVNHCLFFCLPGWDTECGLTWTMYIFKNDACGGKHITTVLLGEL